MSDRVPDLHFDVERIQPVPYAAVPTMGIKLRISDKTPVGVDQPLQRIEHVALQTQIQIEPVLRGYTPLEQERLHDLFDHPSRWSDTLRTLLWTHVNAVVPRFEGSTTIELPVPCSFDFNVGATKYFGGLERGEIPLRLLFNGTIFYRSDDGALQISPISWEREAVCRLPVAEWRRMMDLYHPNSAWLSLRADVFQRLYDFRVRHKLPTWEEAFELMLRAAGDDREPPSILAALAAARPKREVPDEH